MKMKYFQGIADIKNHYEDILRNFEDSRWGIGLLETWDIYPKDKTEILEEYDVVRFLIGCQLGLVRERNTKKPTLEVVERCFNRHIAFLGKFHQVDDFNINKHESSIIKKEFKACRHYQFKFSLPAWYEKLPEEILTYENKYPNFNR